MVRAIVVMSLLVALLAILPPSGMGVNAYATSPRYRRMAAGYRGHNSPRAKSAVHTLARSLNLEEISVCEDQVIDDCNPFYNGALMAREVVGSSFALPADLPHKAKALIRHTVRRALLTNYMGHPNAMSEVERELQALVDARQTPDDDDESEVYVERRELELAMERCISHFMETPADGMSMWTGEQALGQQALLQKDMMPFDGRHIYTWGDKGKFFSWGFEQGSLGKKLSKRGREDKQGGVYSTQVSYVQGRETAHLAMQNMMRFDSITQSIADDERLPMLRRVLTFSSRVASAHHSLAELYKSFQRFDSKRDDVDHKDIAYLLGSMFDAVGSDPASSSEDSDESLDSSSGGFFSESKGQTGLRFPDGTSAQVKREMYKLVYVFAAGEMVYPAFIYYTSLRYAEGMEVLDIPLDSEKTLLTRIPNWELFLKAADATEKKGGSFESTAGLGVYMVAHETQIRMPKLGHGDLCLKCYLPVPKPDEAPPDEATRVDGRYLLNIDPITHPCVVKNLLAAGIIKPDYAALLSMDGTEPAVKGMEMQLASPNKKNLFSNPVAAENVLRKKLVAFRPAKMSAPPFEPPYVVDKGIIGFKSCDFVTHFPTEEYIRELAALVTAPDPIGAEDSSGTDNPGTETESGDGTEDSGGSWAGDPGESTTSAG